MKIKPIEEKNMMEVIDLLDKNLSPFKPDINEYKKIWNLYSSQTNVYSLVAIIDKKIIGYGSITIELKIRGGQMGHIEDIVTHPQYRRQNIGKAIVSELVTIAEKKGCYKVALQCKEHNIQFYKKCNHEISGISMQLFIR